MIKKTNPEKELLVFIVIASFYTF